MLKDFLGNEIKAGCRIAYPCRQGARMWLSTLTVTAVGADRVTGYSATGRRVYVKNVQNVIVIPKEPQQ